MNDLISRKSLYDKMREAEDLARQRVIDTPSSFPNGSLNPAYIRYMTQVSERTRFKEMIYDELSAERKKGRWEMKQDPYGFFEEIPVCSECGCTTKMRDKTKFCPNCGADMRGEQDG